METEGGPTVEYIYSPPKGAWFHSRRQETTGGPEAQQPVVVAGRYILVLPFLRHWTTVYSAHVQRQRGR